MQGKSLKELLVVLRTFNAVSLLKIVKYDIYYGLALIWNSLLVCLSLYMLDLYQTHSQHS